MQSVRDTSMHQPGDEERPQTAEVFKIGRPPPTSPVSGQDSVMPARPEEGKRGRRGSRLSQESWTPRQKALGTSQGE